MNCEELLHRSSYGICNVEENYNFYFNYLLSKLHSLFKWNNLPDTIDEESLNNQLFLNGQTCFTEFDGKLYCLFGNVGGKPNEYYHLTNYVISNPVLGSKTAKILGKDKDSVMMYNTVVDRDTQWIIGSQGLFQLIKQTATLLADNIVSISCAQINSRVQIAYAAESEALANTGEKVLKDLYGGKPYRIMAQKDELEKFSVLGGSTSSTNTIAQLIELQQYIIGQFYQNIGVRFNSTNKKERLITDEINFQDDFLAINLQTMLESRQLACKEINEMFGTDISVELADVLKPVIEEAINPEESNEDEITEETSEAETEEEKETISLEDIFEYVKRIEDKLNTEQTIEDESEDEITKEDTTEEDIQEIKEDIEEIKEEIIEESSEEKEEVVDND